MWNSFRQLTHGPLLLLMRLELRKNITRAQLNSSKELGDWKAIGHKTKIQQCDIGVVTWDPNLALPEAIDW